MDYVEFLLVAWDYCLVLWDYSPWIAYALAFLTLIPKTWRRIRTDVDAELRDVKFHRCYGTERCCHPLESDEVVRPRKKVLRRFAIKRDDKSEPVAHSPPPTLTNHVNQIAKMFEGNARKVNRVTPIITNEQSSELNASDLSLPKKTEELTIKTTLKNLDERFFRPSPVKPNNIPENDENAENSLNLLNRPLEPSTATAPIVIQRRRYPSTSPSPPPRPLSRTSSRPTSLKASIENIFAMANQCTKGSCSPSGPVTSIEEILSQRRLSRPLSAYSISDLLGDSLPDESYIESVFGNLNK